jgi:hypothetical protein
MRTRAEHRAHDPGMKVRQRPDLHGFRHRRCAGQVPGSSVDASRATRAGESTPRRARTAAGRGARTREETLRARTRARSAHQTARARPAVRA